MATIQEIRQQYPQYSDLSDQQLADSMYKAHYSDMPREQFDQKIGYQQKTGNIGQFGPTAMGSVLSGLKDSGFAKGAMVGAEELPYGMAQAGMSVARGLGLKVPKGVAKNAADQVSKIEAQDKGTGLPGALGEMVPALAIPGGEGEAAKGKSLIDTIKQGVKQGAKVGGTFSAVAPTEDPNQGLGGRLVNTAIGTAGGGLVGGASAGLGAGVSKLAGKTELAAAAPKKDNLVQKAANFFGLNFSNAKDDAGIAQEIKRGVDTWVGRMGSMMSDRTPAVTPTDKVGDIGSSVVSKFAQRKTLESGAWNRAEPAGNSIKHDMSEAVAGLTEHLKELENATANGTGTEKAKADLALVKAALAKIGAPVEDGQNFIEKTKDVGGYTRTIEGNRQFPADAARTETKTVEPTTETGGKRFVERTQTPVDKGTAVDGKTKTITQSPYSVTTKITKGPPPKRPREGTAGDLVRVMRDVVNSDKYAQASSETKRAVRDVLNNELVNVSKNNPEFSRLHSKANQATQRNADIYRDEGKLAKLGYDEKGLWDVFNKIRSPNRMVSAENLQKLNNLTDNIKTKEDLLFFRRLLPPGHFNMLMRAKFSTLMSDISMHAGKFEDARPLIEEMMKRSKIPTAKIAESLDHYQTLADRLTEAGLDASGKVSKVEKDAARMKELQKAVLFGGVLRNPKQGLFHGFQAMLPEGPTAEQAALRGFKKAANPTTTLYQNTPSNIPGAMIGQAVKDHQ